MAQVMTLCYTFVMVGPTKTRTVVQLGKEQHEALRQLSAKTGASISWHIRMALAKYLDSFKKKRVRR